MIIECLNYGVGQGEEGVCLTLSLGPHRILLDCGLPELSSLKADWMADGPIDFVFCSHAHPDHARGLLDLHRAFPRLPIYASEVTTHLLPLNWPEEDHIPSFCRALPWRSPIEFSDGLTAELFPAGHLPGAAACLITYATPTSESASASVLYTGDFFLSNTRFADGLPLADVRGLQPDVLIMEASLGTARHPHRRQQENQLADRIHQAIQQGYNIVLPLPALGIAQEILILLRSHHRFTGQDLDIWVGPAIAQACNAYLAVLPHLPTAIQNFAQHQSPFWDQRVRPRVQPLPRPAQFPRDGVVPNIILADHDQALEPYLRNSHRPWLLLYPRLLYGHDTQPTEFIPKGKGDQPIEVESFLLSLHSDGPATTQLIHNIRPQHVVLLHGNPNYLTDLASLNELSNRYHLHTPTPGSRIEMPLGQLSVTVPTTLVNTAYEGDVLEWGDRAVVSLPLEITGDARWRRLADTGFILASWQGEQLILRGMTPKEVLSNPAEIIAAEKDCCYCCQFYRGQRCWNQLSPLYNFKVAPEGYCPGFERVEATPDPPAD